jgi:hypothetical protein
VALYLIVIGLLGLFGGSNYRVGGNAMAEPDAAVVSSQADPAMMVSGAIYRLPDVSVPAAPPSSGAHSSQM